jgi:hypothetical protein
MKMRLGTVSHIYNLRYSGDVDWKDHSLRPAQGKLTETPISTNNLGKMAHGSNPSYTRGIGRRIEVQGWPWAKIREPI